jgi:hypothetical protein
MNMMFFNLQYITPFAPVGPAVLHDLRRALYHNFIRDPTVRLSRVKSLVRASTASETQWKEIAEAEGVGSQR